MQTREYIQFLIEENGEKRHYTSGELLYVSGAYPESVFYLHSGQVQHINTISDRVEADTSDKGSILGFKEMLLGSAYTHSGRSSGRSIVFKMNRTDFFRLLQQDIKFRQAMIKLMSNQMLNKDKGFE